MVHTPPTGVEPAERETPGERLFDVLGDPTRRRIFHRLCHRPMAVGELAEMLPVSQPAVSQHLKVLREVGLVTARKDGRRRVYRARRAGLEPLRRTVEAWWDGALAAFAASFDD